MNIHFKMAVADALTVIVKALRRAERPTADPFSFGEMRMEGLESAFIVEVRERYQGHVDKDCSIIREHSRQIVRDVLLAMWPGLRHRRVSEDELRKAGHPGERPVWDPDDF